MILLLFVTSIASGLIASSLELALPLYYDIEKAEELFEDYIITYDKMYPNEIEKQLRFEFFKENLKLINTKNAIGGAVFIINHLSDLSQEEFRLQFLGFEPSFGDHQCEEVYIEETVEKNIPPSVNWVKKGAVTGVKNQADCGSCWAFGTIGNIEGQYFIKNKKLQVFSEQQLVDCSKHNAGCRGGDMAVAMSDLMDLGGVELNSTYPYEAKNQQCKFDKTKVVANLTGCKVYNLTTEDKLLTLLAEKGPLTVGVNGVDITVNYHRGVLQKDHCSADVLDHAVLLVGYGTDEKEGDYWLLKNSWGTSFGEGGYFRISRGENTCGIMKYIVSADM